MVGPLMLILCLNTNAFYLVQMSFLCVDTFLNNSTHHGSSQSVNGLILLSPLLIICKPKNEHLSLQQYKCIYTNIHRLTLHYTLESIIYQNSSTLTTQLILAAFKATALPFHHCSL